MSRVRSNPVRAKAALGALALILVAGLAACEEDGKTAPERCADPPLPIFDIQAGAPADTNPCVTAVGHSISMGPSTSGGTTAITAGTSSGGKGGSGGSAGKGGSGGTATADAGAGGAGGAGGAP
jgi:hypothetical protein